MKSVWKYMIRRASKKERGLFRRLPKNIRYGIWSKFFEESVGFTEIELAKGVMWLSVVNSRKVK